jgi:hypothetical protein
MNYNLVVSKKVGLGRQHEHQLETTSVNNIAASSPSPAPTLIPRRTVSKNVGQLMQLQHQLK